MRRARIAGLSTYVPPRVLANADLEKLVETSDEWILQRTGIRERHIVDSGMATSDMAKEAAVGAIRQAGITPQDVGFIVVGTTTPDTIFPSTACTLQAKIKAAKSWGFDLGAACSGFLYSLTVGWKMVASGSVDHAVVVGADVMSSIIDYTDRATCVLFGDGAGAVILQATRGDHGILGSIMKSNGNYHDFICMPGGGSDRPANDPKSIEEKLPFIKMKGNETFKVAVKAMADVSQELLAEQGFTHEQIDLFIPHQANLRIIDAVGEKLKIDPRKVYKNIDRFGNTSAASIPIALDECVREGRVKDGDLVLLTAFGAGLVWGSVLLRW
jgi:3-oxoacyl-[acyl-carrier-protein] synthase-3